MVLLPAVTQIDKDAFLCCVSLTTISLAPSRHADRQGIGFLCCSNLTMLRSFL